MALKSEINPTGKRVVETSDLWRRNGHRGGVMWFTGLSGSGKSTLAAALEGRLFEEGYNVVSLDGDNLRHGLNADLGFAPDDRAENIRRVGELAAMLTHGGMGYAKEYHVERYMREVMIARIAPVSREMIFNFIGEKVLGLPRSF